MINKDGLLSAILIIGFMVISVGFGYYSPKVEEIVMEEEQYIENIENVEVKYYEDKKYYVSTGSYDGDYDYQRILLDYNNEHDIVSEYNKIGVLNYYEYYDFCQKWNLEQKYDDESLNYMVIAYAKYDTFNVAADIISIVKNKIKITVYLHEEVEGITANIGAYFIAIPVESNIVDGEVNVVYTPEEYENILKYGKKYNPYNMTDDKPIIYIYPEEETNVTIKLSNSENILVSYPVYNDKWSVIASPNGNLKDYVTNKNYYGLYYEAINHNVSVKEDGFIVKGEDTISFLEEKLSILGLNEKESNEFIIYWLPKLQNNKYNYIRFETIDEINKYMSLDIDPKPDTLIRVLMDYKPLDEKINIKEEILTPVTRTGYTVVEWGGSKIN